MLSQYGINKGLIQTYKRKSRYIEDLLSNVSDISYAVCPFTVILGALNTTEAGYKPANLIVNNYTNFQKVFTGRESVLAIWDNSFTTTQVRTKGGDETNNYGVLKINRYADGTSGGDRFYGSLLDVSTTTSFNKSPGNNEMTGMVNTKTITLLFKYKDNQNFIDKITNNIYKFYVIPELFPFKDKNINFIPLGSTQLSAYQIDREWYFISSCSLVYKQTIKDVDFAIISFQSVNDNIANSGMAINQYVQISAPGDRCPFPTVNKDKKIVCDEAYLNGLNAVTHAQINLYGTYLLNNISFYGRPVRKIGQVLYEWKIEAPRLIFPYRFQAPFYDNLFVNAVAETNYYALIDAIPQIIFGWQSWKDELQATYNQFQKKQYEGYLSLNKGLTYSCSVEWPNVIDKDYTFQGSVVDSNPNPSQTSRKSYFPFWDTRFLNGVDSKGFSTTSFSVKASEYFWNNPNINHPDLQTQVGLESFIPNDLKTQSLAQWNMLNFFIYKQFYQLQLNLYQTTPMAIGALPSILGYFVNYVFGIPTGFALHSGDVIPSSYQLQFLMSVGMAQFCAALTGSSSRTGAFVNIPFDIFKKETSSDLNSLLGTSSQTTAFCFNLTNTLQIAPTLLNGALNPSYGPIETIDTVHLGQIKKDKSAIYLIEPQTTLQAPKDNEGYVIDSLAFQGLGQLPYKLTFYSQMDKSQPLDENKGVWVGTYKTLAAASSNTRLWTNQMRLNNPDFKFKDYFFYPENINVAPVQGGFTKEILQPLQDIEMGYVTTLQWDDEEKYTGKVYRSSTPPYNPEGAGFYGNFLSYLRTATDTLTFYIDDIYANEIYKATKAVFTINPLRVSIDMNGLYAEKVYSFSDVPINLSKANDFWIYYFDKDGTSFPFYGEIYDDNDLLIFPQTKDGHSCHNYILDLTNEKDEIIIFPAKTHNSYPFPIFYPQDGSRGIVDHFFAYNTIRFNGRSLHAHLNFTSVWNQIEMDTGLYVFLEGTQEVKCIISKKRDELKKRWIITFTLKFDKWQTNIGWACVATITNHYPDFDRNIFFHNLVYYQLRDAKPIGVYGNFSGENGPENGSITSKEWTVTYQTKNKIKN